MRKHSVGWPLEGLRDPTVARSKSSMDPVDHPWPHVSTLRAPTAPILAGDFGGVGVLVRFRLALSVKTLAVDY